MKASCSIRRRMAAVVLSTLAMASSAMAASFIAPLAYTVETEDQNEGADGNFANKNSKGGIIWLGGEIAGQATCNQMAWTWAGSFDTPSGSGLTQMELAIDLQDVNGNFTEGATEPIYVTN